MKSSASSARAEWLEASTTPKPPSAATPGRSANDGGNAPPAGGMSNGAPSGWSNTMRCRRPQR